MAESPFGFGLWLKKRRTELRLPLRVFATKAGLDAGNVSKYERGLLPPPQDPEKLKRMAKTLQLRKGSDEYTYFMDLAATAAGKIPPDLVAPTGLSIELESQLPKLPRDLTVVESRKATQ